jgi:predicted negative regulator of RcsB-dependent stress response
MIDKIVNTIKHYWTDHKKALIVVGVIIVIALVW